MGGGAAKFDFGTVVHVSIDCHEVYHPLFPSLCHRVAVPATVLKFAAIL